MQEFSNRRFSWLLAGTARLNPYHSTPTLYVAQPRVPAVVPQTMVDKVEDLVQTAYAQADRQTGRHLAAVLRNLRRRIARPTHWDQGGQASPAAPNVAPQAANDP